jgi:Uma2 family endonuclease
MCAFEYYTYDDYKQWEGDWELIDGIAYAMAPAPMRKHQSIGSKIISLIDKQITNCLECEILGEVDYKIDEYTTIRPDVVLTCGETHEYHLTIAPLIVVEVVSKSSIKRDEKIKFELYEKEKVPYYIIVYPDDLRAKIFKLENNAYTKEGDFLDTSYTFTDIKCKDIKLDFKEVFKKYRK